MTVENQSSIRFSVEESIWFQKGQEVSELLSMSLDPDIVIQEHEQYISVRGGLILTGEYYTQVENDSVELNRPQGARQVNEVVVREDGVSELRHRFPVDITIPKNRIQNLNDVYVTIDAFDYELPERGNLLMEAELSITGIYGDTKPLSQSDESDRDELEVLPNQEEYEVDVEIKAENEVEVEVREEEVVASANEVEEPTNNEFLYQEEQKVDVERELVEPLMRGSFYVEEKEETENDNLFTPFVVEAKSENLVSDFAKEDEQVEDEGFIFTRLTPQFELKSRVENQSSKEEVSNNLVDENQNVRDENALYLTKLFTQEEYDTTRLKICIVQKDETIESIALRYGVQAQSLIRVNNLDREHVAEGQILYIPVPVAVRR